MQVETMPASFPEGEVNTEEDQHNVACRGRGQGGGVAVVWLARLNATQPLCGVSHSVVSGTSARAFAEYSFLAPF